MDYTFLTQEEQLNAVANRIHQLEQEYYSNTVFMTECELVNDGNTFSELSAKNEMLEIRISGLKKQLTALQTTELEDGDDPQA